MERIQQVPRESSNSNVSIDRPIAVMRVYVRLDNRPFAQWRHFPFIFKFGNPR